MRYMAGQREVPILHFAQTSLIRSLARRYMETMSGDVLSVI
jgi:hypothetical protein